jgi:hypothetical protein
VIESEDSAGRCHGPTVLWTQKRDIVRLNVVLRCIGTGQCPTRSVPMLVLADRMKDVANAKHDKRKEINKGIQKRREAHAESNSNEKPLEAGAPQTPIGHRTGSSALPL